MADDGAAGAVEEWPATTPGQAAGLVAIRVTQADDFEVIKPLVEEYHRESRYGHIPFSEHKLQRVVIRAINSPDTMLGAYVRYRDRAVGIVHANAGDYYLGEGGCMVTVQGIYVAEAVRTTALGSRVMLKLMRLLADWAFGQGGVRTAYSFHFRHCTPADRPHVTALGL